jgi:HlyD family secretion protein
VGDFIGSFERVAVIANNNALEIVAFVGDSEREQLVEGDEVLIDGTATGIVTTIAPSIDEATRKTEVRIATNDASISNGDTVRISKQVETEERLTTILVPLSAVKFEASDGFIMQVENGIVTQKPVTLGPVRGNQVTITAGLSPDEPFIRDVRGLTAGTVVSIRE